MSNRYELYFTGLVISIFILLSLSALHVSLSPQQSSTQSFTELYILNENGNASDYPKQLVVGESATVRVGIGNRENRRQTYTLVVRLSDRIVTSQSVTLESNEVWERPVTFSPTEAGIATVRFELYIGEGTDSGDSYRKLRLKIHVSE